MPVVGFCIGHLLAQVLQAITKAHVSGVLSALPRYSGFDLIKQGHQFAAERLPLTW